MAKRKIRLPKGPKLDFKSLLGLTLAGLAYQNRDALGQGIGKGFNWMKGLFGKGGDEAMGPPLPPDSYDVTNPMNINMQDSYDPLNPDNFSQEEYMEDLGESWDPSNPFNESLETGMGWNQQNIGFDEMSFNDAFRTNRNAGAPTFNWRGNEYTTELAKPEAAVPSSGKTTNNNWVAESLETLSNNRYADLDNVVDDFKDASHYGSRDQSSLDNFKDDFGASWSMWGPAIDNFKRGFGLK